MRNLNEYINEDFLFEMANIESKYTGLKNTIWVNTVIPGSPAQSKHKKPRIKIEINHELVPFSIEDEPRILVKNINISSKEYNAICEFIKNNKDILLDYNKGNIGTGELIEKLRKHE